MRNGIPLEKLPVGQKEKLGDNIVENTLLMVVSPVLFN
jgi:hypothetical protein